MILSEERGTTVYRIDASHTLWCRALKDSAYTHDDGSAAVQGVWLLAAVGARAGTRGLRGGWQRP